MRKSFWGLTGRRKTGESISWEDLIRLFDASKKSLALIPPHSYLIISSIITYQLIILFVIFNAIRNHPIPKQCGLIVRNLHFDAVLKNPNIIPLDLFLITFSGPHYSILLPVLIQSKEDGSWNFDFVFVLDGMDD